MKHIGYRVTTFVLSAFVVGSLGIGCGGSPSSSDSTTSGSGGENASSSSTGGAGGGNAASSSSSGTGGVGGGNAASSSSSGTGGVAGTGGTGGVGEQGGGGQGGGGQGGQGGGGAYDPAVDFSANQNPAGPWSYGWSDSMGAPLQLYPETLSKNMLQQWGQTNATLSLPPYVIFNPNDSTLVEGSYTMPPKSLNLHPGLNGEYSIVRWTAPAPGSYHVTATFSAMDNTTTDVAIQQSSSTALFTGYVNVGSPAAFTGDITVQAGETIDFMVGFGGNGYICDSTQLQAKITSL